MAYFGVNYEGHKISQYAHQKGAKFIVNIQISMDAPFHGEVADEKTRKKLLSESQFRNYDERQMKEDIKKILMNIETHCIQKNIRKVIIQIARGRSGKLFFDKNIKEFLSEHIDYEINYGYKSDKFFNNQNEEQFGFLNIGMFARLNLDYNSGEVFECEEGVAVSYNEKKEIIKMEVEVSIPKEKFIINNQKKVTLIGISDEMPFVTPKDYELENFNNLLE